MFKVLFIEAGKAYTEKTLFKTFNEKDAWDFYISKMRVSEVSGTVLSGLYVTDKAGTFLDPPRHVWECLARSAA